MSSLKVVAVFLAALCGVFRGGVASSCDVAVQVDYSVGTAPSPLCSLTCSDSSSGLWINGVVYRRFSALQQNFQQMVKLTFKSGQLASCTLVPYLSEEQLQEQALSLQAALDECSGRAEPTLPTTGASEPTTEPTTISITDEPTTFESTTIPTTEEPTTIPTTPEPTTTPTTTTTTTPAPTTTPTTTTTTPAPTTTPTTTTTTPAPTTTTTTTTAKPTTTATTAKPTTTATTTKPTTTTTTLPPITYSCPSGFTKYGDVKCYRAFTAPLSWSLALAACRTYGATLARITSSAEYNFVKSVTDKTFWTDINDITTEGKYVFSDYKTAAYLSWASDEPTGSSWYSFLFSGDDCVSLVPNKGMYDDSCDDTYSYVCERATTPSR